MAKVFTDDPEEVNPEEKPKSDEHEEAPESAPRSASSEVPTDPLSELRKDLFDEENTPQSTTSRPDLLHRMTGNLGSRKGSNRSEDDEQPHSRFGVRTAGAQPGDSEEDAGEGTGEEHPRSPVSPDSRWRRPASFETGAENPDEDELLEDQEGEESGLISKVRPPISRPSDSSREWSDEPAEESQPGTKADEKSEDRKRLPSGFDRQKQVSRFISYNPRRSLRARLKELSPVEKMLAIVLILAVLAVIVLIIYLYLESQQPGFVQKNILPASSSPTATVPVSPTPIGMKLPGGWSFQIGAGMMVDGKWSPTKSEWLVGTEIRRVIAIPWNKQIEAVVRTFDTGDTINLQMSNGDNLVYKVKSVSYVLVSDSSILYDTRPSLAVILNRPGDSSRWVVIAAP